MSLQFDRYWAAFFADTRRRSRLKRVALMTRDVIRRHRIAANLGGNHVRSR